jgi:hypothetical protein
VTTAKEREPVRPDGKFVWLRGRFYRIRPVWTRLGPCSIDLFPTVEERTPRELADRLGGLLVNATRCFLDHEHDEKNCPGLYVTETGWPLNDG